MAIEQLIDAYNRMYLLTNEVCSKQCRAPLSCCSPEYCELTIEHARGSWGVELKRTGHATLPLMGPTGCTVAPHLRPLCTLHACPINGLGTFKDQAKDDAYFELRAKIDELEYGRQEVNHDG